MLFFFNVLTTMKNKPFNINLNILIESPPHIKTILILFQDDIDDDIPSPHISRKTSYTREYVRNLPLVVPPVSALPTPSANAAR